MMLETADPMIERFDPVMELRVGQFQERAQFLKFSIHVFAVFGMPAIEMQLKSLGDRLDIVAKPFNQHTGVTFDLVSSGGDFVAEACSRSFLGLAQRDDVLAQFSGGGFRRLAQRGHVLAQALGDRRHDPFNLCKGF